MNINYLFAIIRGTLFRFYCALFKRRVTIGKGFKKYTRVSMEGPGKVVIGDNCIMTGVKGNSSIFVTLYTLDLDACIAIGNNVELHGARISTRFATVIGDNAIIEESGIMDTAFHSFDPGRGCPQNETRPRCEVRIGDNTIIGARSLIGKGVTIGDNTTVLPGSVVTLSLPASCVARGNPAKPVKEAISHQPSAPANLTIACSPYQSSRAKVRP